MAKKSKWPVAVFMTKKFRRIAEFILNMKTLIINIGNAPLIFVTPSPAIAALNTNLQALEDAETKAKTRVIGAAADRDVKYDVCYKDLKDVTGYVQSVANNAADAPAAIAIIETSGLSVRVNGTKIKAPIEAKNGLDEGVVELIAKSAGRDTVYMWERSADGIAWSELPLTQIAKTTVDSLTAGQRMYFRVRTRNQRDGTSEWSAAVVIMVV
ncbi:MAG: hypothetical protein D4R43_00840 [Sphingobacteriales bacterium]|nr:MAG: hypothetical protein D4R43_00840 [Sphingobacteriales bacterium]